MHIKLDQLPPHHNISRSKISMGALRTKWAIDEVRVPNRQPGLIKIKLMAIPSASLRLILKKETLNTLRFSKDKNHI